jgi:hypothetical protein
MLPEWLAILLIVAALVGGFCNGLLWGRRHNMDAFKRGYDVGHKNGLEHAALSVQPRNAADERLMQAINRMRRMKVCPKCGQDPYDGHGMCSGPSEQHTEQRK